jgi:hypothetical protein
MCNLRNLRNLRIKLRTLNMCNLRKSAESVDTTPETLRLRSGRQFLSSVKSVDGISFLVPRPSHLCKSVKSVDELSFLVPRPNHLCKSVKSVDELSSSALASTSASYRSPASRKTGSVPIIPDTANCNLQTRGFAAIALDFPPLSPYHPLRYATGRRDV